MKVQTIQCTLNEVISEAWQDQLIEASQNSHLANSILRRGSDVKPRFAYFYQKLLGLPRRTRRALCRKPAITLASTALMLALSSDPVDAVTIPVDGTACTLADAITAANADTATGSCIAGSGADILELEAGSTHTLTSVNNNTYGANGLPVISSEIIIEGHGSTIQRDSNAPDFRILTVGRDSKFTLNEATITGGVVSTIIDTVNNDDNNGGGAGLYGYDADVSINDCIITGNNTSSESGRGAVFVYSYNTASLSISDSTISGNTAKIGGGVAADSYFYNGRFSLSISGSTISGNTADISGGGVDIRAGYSGEFSLNLVNSTISGNTSGEGGGIYIDKGNIVDFDVSLIDNTIADNIASGSGGGIAIMGRSVYSEEDVGTTTISSSAIIGNSAGDKGGGLSVNATREYLPTSIIEGSTISGNTASSGGGIAGASTFDFSYYSDITFTVDNSTITGNTATSNGGGAFGESDVVSMIFNRSLVSGNTAAIGSEVSSVGDVTADNFNLFGFDGNEGVDGFTPGPNDIVPSSGIQLSDILNPVLADNGGSTFTHALVTGSPAVDIIPSTDPNCTGTDQRGVERPQGIGCDIGAFELEQGDSSESVFSTDRDSIIQKNRGNYNEGANPLLSLNGARSRLVVGFNLSEVELLQVVSATLIFTVNDSKVPNNWGSNGSNLDVHRLLESSWVEGNGKSLGLPSSEKSEGVGQGVTWNCSIDDQIDNQNSDCVQSWNGGNFAPTPSDSVLHLNGMTGEVEFNVTADVLDGANSWLLKRNPDTHGRVHYYAKDHPDVNNDSNLAPRLLLVFQP